MNRATAIILVLILVLLGGAAWLLLGVSGNRDGGLSENPFALDEDEELIEPGALDDAQVERTGVLSEEERAESAAAAAGPQTFEKSTIRGRHLDAQGMPIQEPPLLVMEIGARLWANANMAKDELGVFQGPLSQPEEKAAGSWLCLRPRVADSDLQTAAVQDAWVFARAVDPLTRLQDVGDLVSGSGPTALGGIVTDLDRRPIAGARVEVVWSADGGKRNSMVFLALSGADGRFRFLGSWPDAGKWIARASHPEFLAAEQPFAPGAANVQLMLPRGSALRGRVLVDPEISLERLGIRVRARTDGSKKWQMSRQLQLDPKTGEFAAAGLVNGWGRIRVYDSKLKWNLYFQYGIPLPAGLDAQVPELQPLDLRGRLRNCKITVLQADGSLAKDVMIVAHSKAGARKFGMPNPLECIVPSETIQLFITAEHCIEQAVFITGAEQSVRLEASPRVAFRAQSLPILEADCRLNFSVNGIEGTEGRWDLKFDDAGAAELDLSPGRYVLIAQPGLQRGSGASFSKPLPLLPGGAPHLEFTVGASGHPSPVIVQVDADAARVAWSALRSELPR